MACPTCDHTMQKIGEDGGVPVFHCPRCGTVKANVARGTDIVPMLVGHVIQFAGLLTADHEELIEAFERLGIHDSITSGDVE